MKFSSNTLKLLLVLAVIGMSVLPGGKDVGKAVGAWFGETLKQPIIFLMLFLWLLIGLLIFFSGLGRMQQARLIENTPTSKIRSLALGLVEVLGNPVPLEGALQTSPFARKNCVYYKYTIEEWRKVNRGSKHYWEWVTIKSEEYRPGFYLRDETGQILVDPSGAEISIPEDFEYTTCPAQQPPGSLREYVAARKLNEGDYLSTDKNIRYKESSIGVADKVYILGTAAENSEAKQPEDLADHTKMLIIKKEKGFYYISNQRAEKIPSNLRKSGLRLIVMGVALCLLIVYGIIRLIGL